MLSRKIRRPKVVVRSLFWMICKGLVDRPTFDGVGGKTLASPIDMSYATRIDCKFVRI
jgi:hypothetical protein